MRSSAACPTKLRTPCWAPLNLKQLLRRKGPTTLEVDRVNCHWQSPSGLRECQRCRPTRHPRKAASNFGKKPPLLVAGPCTCKLYPHRPGPWAWKTWNADGGKLDTQEDLTKRDLRPKVQRRTSMPLAAEAQVETLVERLMKYSRAPAPLPSLTKAERVPSCTVCTRSR